MAQLPEIFVLAGPNGAGKTTAARLVLPQRFRVTHFVNADDIQRDLGPETSPVAAGRTMLSRMKRLRDAGQSFGFETTLAARTYVRFLEQAQQVGYFVHLAFISLRTPELARTRVADRVAAGGHDIPPEDIDRRFRRGLNNFFELYQPLANAWTLCDNSGGGLVVVAQGTRVNTTSVFDQKQFEEIRREARRHIPR